VRLNAFSAKKRAYLHKDKKKSGRFSHSQELKS
jgi:hypothetical protein